MVAVTISRAVTSESGLGFDSGFESTFTGLGIGQELEVPESELARNGLQLESDSEPIPSESTKYKLQEADF